MRQNVKILKLKMSYGNSEFSIKSMFNYNTKNIYLFNFIKTVKRFHLSYF